MTPFKFLGVIPALENLSDGLTNAGIEDGNFTKEDELFIVGEDLFVDVYRGLSKFP